MVKNWRGSWNQGFFQQCAPNGAAFVNISKTMKKSSTGNCVIPSVGSRPISDFIKTCKECSQDGSEQKEAFVRAIQLMTEQNLKDIERVTWEKLDFLKCMVHIGRGWQKKCTCSADNAVLDSNHPYYYQFPPYKYKKIPKVEFKMPISRIIW